MRRLDVVFTDLKFVKPLWLALKSGGADGWRLGNKCFPNAAEAGGAELGAVKMPAHDQIHPGVFERLHQARQWLHDRTARDLEGQQRVVKHENPQRSGGVGLKLLPQRDELARR